MKIDRRGALIPAMMAAASRNAAALRRAREIYRALTPTLNLG